MCGKYKFLNTRRGNNEGTKLWSTQKEGKYAGEARTHSYTSQATGKISRGKNDPTHSLLCSPIPAAARTWNPGTLETENRNPIPTPSLFPHRVTPTPPTSTIALEPWKLEPRDLEPWKLETTTLPVPSLLSLPHPSPRYSFTTHLHHSTETLELCNSGTLEPGNWKLETTTLPIPLPLSLPLSLPRHSYTTHLHHSSGILEHGTSTLGTWNSGTWKPR